MKAKTLSEISLENIKRKELMYKVIQLRLCNNLFCNVGRIGYPDEGLRLTFFDKTPYNFHTEIQLSKEDTKELIEVLQANLEYHTNNGLK